MAPRSRGGRTLPVVRHGEQLTGKERTKAVTESILGWLTKRNYSCAVELAILPYGNRRCDIVALNLQRDIIIVEVKQSWSDFKNDRKWQEYLPFANRFYFAFPYDLWEDYQDIITDTLAGTTAGVVVLMRDGLAKVVRNSSAMEPSQQNKRDVITRLAWRGGISVRTFRRYRIYI